MVPGARRARSDIRVEPNRVYHFTITRRGGALDWAIDGRPFLAWTDPEPLAGRGPRVPGGRRLGGRS